MTRNPAPVNAPVVTTIAGSDSGGGAGIQADLKTIEATGCFGTSVVTSVTAQNTGGVESTHVLPTDEIDAQVSAIFEDFDVRAVKTGMLATRDIVELVAERASTLSVPVVVDPVMVAATGDRLLDADAEAAYESLVGEATLVTPNAAEAEVLTGVEISDEETALEVGDRLLEMGADAALLKGGHVPGERVSDILLTRDDVTTVTHPRIETEATHGSGCMLSAAIASHLARGDDLETAVTVGIDLLQRAIRYGLDVGQGPGSVHHLVDSRNRAERSPTVDRVEWAVEQLQEHDVSRLVPEVGMNVVGATPYAESPTECAAVEGRITSVRDGIAPNRGVRLGVSSHVARFLLAAREFDPDIRFAANCRFDDQVEKALTGVSGPAVEFDRTAEPENQRERDGETMQWVAREAFESVDASPVAVFDRGAVGKEPMVRLLATDAETLCNRLQTIDDSIPESEN